MAMRLIDRYVPQADFREQHALRIFAPAPALLAAAATYRPESDPFFRRMIGAREWPHRIRQALLGSGDAAPTPFGIDNFTLLARNENEIVYGLAGRFWKLDYGLEPIADGAHFLALHTPRIAKLALNFAVENTSAHGTLLSTETRISCVDAAARRAFAPYWYLIRPVSGLIRRRILGGIGRASAAAEA